MSLRRGRTRMTLRRVLCALTAAVWLVPTGFAQSPSAKPVRVGILGLDNYQAVAFTQLFNDPKAAGDLKGLRVVAAYPATVSDDIPESVASLSKWKEAVA